MGKHFFRVWDEIIRREQQNYTLVVNFSSCRARRPGGENDAKGDNEDKNPAVGGKNDRNGIVCLKARAC